MTPTKIGRYEIKAELGRGGMATVFRGFDPRFMRDVAIKVLPREFLHDPTFRARFEREARTIAALEHPAIVPVYDFGEEDGQPYIVMRLMIGGSLADRLAKGPLSLAESARIFGQLAPALDRAHAKGIIHRDLKPGNILFDEDGHPYISDFGIAKLTAATAAFTGTAIVGTPAYMSPEQARGDREIDGRSDIYALGAIVYQMLTGKLPFDADTPMGIALKHITEPAPSIRAVRPDLPADCDMLISTAMAKSRDDRFRTASNMAESLTAVASGKPSQLSEPRETIKVPPKVDAPRPQPIPTVREAPPLTHPEKRQPTPPPTGKRAGVGIGIAVVGGILAVCAASIIAGIIFGPSLLNLGPAAPAATAKEESSNVAAATRTPLPVAASATPAIVPTATTVGCPEPVDVATAPRPANPKTVVGGTANEPDKIVPYFGFNGEFAQLVLLGLIEYDLNGNTDPELAESWEMSSDGLTLTFTLRDCLYWSDGKPITSQDVKFTLDAINDPRNTVDNRAGYDQIQSVTALDDRTIIIRFTQVYPEWPALFAAGSSSPGVILPEHILGGLTGLENNEFIRQPTVSSGPFIISEWAAGDHITLIANPNFYKGRANIDKVVIRFHDNDVALAALQARDLDWYADFSELDLASLESAASGFDVFTAPDIFVEHYVFNLGTTAGVGGVGKSDADGFCPFQDVRVRQAIILGIDREQIIGSLLNGRTFVPGTFWGGSHWGSSDIQPDPYDPEKAKQLLEEAGYPVGTDGIRVGVCNGQRTRLAFNFYTTTRQLRIDMASMVQDYLRRIGVEFIPNPITASNFFGAYENNGVLATGHYDMAGFAGGIFPDPHFNWWLCGEVPSRDHPAGSNYYHYCNPALDQLFDEAYSSADQDAREQAYHRIQRFMYLNALMIPMYQRVRVAGISNRLVIGPFNGYTGFYWNAEEWDVR